MGCDYYTWVETVIIYTDVSGNEQKHIHQEEWEKHYLSEYASPTEIQEMIACDSEFHGTISYYDAGGWDCTEEDRQSILEICNTRTIPEDAIVSVCERLNGWVRNSGLPYYFSDDV